MQPPLPAPGIGSTQADAVAGTGSVPMQASHLGPDAALAGSLDTHHLLTYRTAEMAHQQRGSGVRTSEEGTVLQAATLQTQHRGVKRPHEAADEQEDLHAPAKHPKTGASADQHYGAGSGCFGAAAHDHQGLHQ